MGIWKTGILIGLCALAGCDGESSGTGTGGAGGEGGTTSTPAGPKCTGTPKPCEERSSFDCSPEAGCDDDGACAGEAVDCEDVPDEQSCTFQYGCVWTPSKGACEGDPAACPTLGTAPQCSFQVGCGWLAGACSGYPYACEKFQSEGGCYVQTGCDWK